jgi:hypothetical protein
MPTVGDTSFINSHHQDELAGTSVDEECGREPFIRMALVRARSVLLFGLEARVVDTVGFNSPGGHDLVQLATLAQDL